MFKTLKSILEYEISKDRPLLTVIVFLDNINRPSPKFFTILEELGVKDKNIGDEMFYKDNFADVYLIWGDIGFYDYYKFQSY